MIVRPTSRALIRISGVCLIAGVAGGLPAQSREGGWREARPGYGYSFPEDHAAHPDFRIEWWYFTGNLATDAGRRFGYQLTFFRTGIRREPENPSRWAVRDLHLAHFAITDIGRGTFRSFERINRRGIGWAGAAADHPRVWNEDWEARFEDGRYVLRARAGTAAISLRLRPRKPPVIHGEDGISRKGGTEGNASHYYSLTRLETAGVLELDGEAHRVRGLSWMDHEFGTTFLEEEQVGWDWISIQLEDGRDLMVFRLRRADGTLDPRSSGTLVLPDGTAVPLAPEDFSLRPSGRLWRSEDTGAEYPVSWRVSVSLPARELDLEVEAALAAQELRTPGSTGVSYWEGAVRVRGADGADAVAGRGYLEMTGYAGRPLSRVLR